MAVQQEQQFQPTYNEEQTRRLVKAYQDSPGRFQEQDLEAIRQHSHHHNVPFYEGDFSIMDALRQAGGGFFEGFTTLRISDPPDNEYEAVARNIGHLAGFVPGLLSAPLKALGLIKAARAVGAVKSIPMLGADVVSKQAKKLIKPILKGARGSRYNAVDAASTFMLGEKAKHMAEGAFHLGTASAISSVWDGVDQMMHSFLYGGLAGGVFRGIGNVIPGTTSGDKAMRTISGSLFMGLPTTMRGATTPEQIYEYLAGAYFGGKEMPWFRAKAYKGINKMDKEAQKNPKLEMERNPEEMEGWEEYPEMVQKEMKKISIDRWGTPKDRQTAAYFMMDLHGITDKIPAENLSTEGYKALSAIRKGQQKKTRKSAHDLLGVGMSGGAKGADTQWAKVLDKYGFPVIHYMPETPQARSSIKSFFNRKVKGVDRGLSEKELLESGPAIEKANKTLQRRIDKMKPYNQQMLYRNAWQVKNAQSVYAVGEIETSLTGRLAHLNGRTVKKGTGWAVQMGIDKGLQKVFVYDTVQRKWFQWSKEVNRFKKLDSPPKLTQNPAVIGTRGDIKYKDTSGNWVQRLSAHAKRAIEDVAEVTFGNQKISKIKDKDAVSQKDIKIYSPEVIKKIDDTRDEIFTRQNAIKDINDVLKQGKIDKVRIKELKVQKKELTREIKDFEKHLSKYKKLEDTSGIDYTGDELANGIDTGSAPSQSASPLMKKGEYFASEFLSSKWDIADIGPISKRDRMLDYGKQVEMVIRNYVEEGNKNVKSIEAINDIQKGLDIKKLSDKGKGYIRKWLTELNLGKQVIYIKTRGGKLQFTDPQRPTSLSGKNIRQIEPPKLIQEVYEAEGGKLDKGIGSSLVVFDNVSTRKKNGISIDVDLNKLVNHFKYNENLSDAEALIKANSLKARVIKDMVKNHDMYPLGGQGDKGRVVFVKFHPKTQSSSTTKLSKDLINIRKSLKKVDKNTLKYLRSDKAKAKRELGITGPQFDKMLHSNVMYDLSLNGFENNPANIAKVMGPGFIPNAIAYNKRAQIWMTNGYGGNKEYIKTQIKDLSKEGDYKYMLIGDPKSPKGKSSLKALNIELPEHVDGAILVRDDVVDAINLDAGHPESGQNKSFIVDPSSKHGALLGKYMIHKVGPVAQEAMKDKGVHMLIMTSAAKQTGTRKVGDYEVADDMSLTFKGGEVYKLDPGNVKYNSSVTNDHHMIQRQIWVKQLFTNLHEYAHSPISKDIMSDIHKEVIQKAFNGDPEVNKRLDAYIKTLDNSKIDYLLKHLEDIGTDELIAALKTPGAERFSERAMQSMLRIVERDIEESFRSGEISQEQRAQSISVIKDSVSPIDRILKNVAVVGEEAAMEGKAGYSGYMHKYVKDYRQRVLHNYFVKSVTTPRMDNSALARMRPYDKWMQKKFPKLMKDDTIFYLDNAYRDTKIKLPDGKTVRLEDIWMKRMSKHKEIADDVLEAIVLRVPMDSISGAHKLKFDGFTGRDGHGILLHARAMRALGGADLDGDEAFVYFGGKRADGTGYGMKKSWKDAIHANKEEYYDKDGIKDNKAAFRDLLTIGAGKDNPMKTSKALFYSPYSRLKASEGAMDGRERLGQVVTQAQVMKSAYSALMEATGKKDSFDIKLNKKFYNVTITPKTSTKEQQYQRELIRAQIGFASDPLDEAGLVSPEKFFFTAHNAHFNTTYKHKGKIVKEPNNLMSYHLKKGLFKNFKNMNDAYFSRNYAEGRNFTMAEVNERAADVANLTEAQKNTLLPKMVETLEGLDWSDNLFNRMDKKATKAVYAEINDMVKEFEWLKPIMKRASFKVPYNKHIQTVLKNKLYDRFHRREIALDSSPDGLNRFIDVIKGTTWGNQLSTEIQKKEHLFNYKKRMRILEQISQQGEDFMSNDLADMATLLNIKRILKKGNFDRKRIGSIHRQSEMFKARSYLNVRERRELDYSAYLGTAEEIQHAKNIEFLMRGYKKLTGEKVKDKDLIGDKRSAAWDQSQLDAKIAEYKGKLKSDLERELFDHFMVGTLNRGNLAKVHEAIKKIPQKHYSPALNDLVTKMINEASKTKQSRLAFNSEEISNEAIQNHFRAMNDVFSDTFKPSSKEEISKTTDEVKKALDKGNVGEISIVDDLVQGAHKGEGYAGLKPGEVTNKDKATITAIATMLKKHNNKLGNNLPDLNEQIRGITEEIGGMGKNLNTLHRQDFENIKRYLEEVEGGTIWQKIWKSDKPEMQKRYWSLFPATVNRELMKHDILWLKKEGYFVTKETESGISATPGQIRRPTYFLDILQNWIHKSNALSTGKAEQISKEIEQDFINISELKQGNELFRVSVAQKELGIKEMIDKMDEPASIKKYYRLVYDQLRNTTEKEVKWKTLKDKEFTLSNDIGERITATGSQIVNGSSSKNLKGIKDKITERFESLHKVITGDKKVFNKYKTGEYFNPEGQKSFNPQPKMNWKLFVEDMSKALEKGDNIAMDIGIDGMRHISRSMMHDLGGKKMKDFFRNFTIENTGQVKPDSYWPHMFFDRNQAEASMKRAIEFIRNDGTLTAEQKKKAINNIAIRHKTLTGDWEFQDMQEWDKVDVLEFGESLEKIATKKSEKEAKMHEKGSVKWTDMNQRAGAMFSRKGHIPGWSIDMNVMDAYVKNITNTYYRQLSQIMSRKVMDDAYHRMSKKFGADLATRWQKYFKLYVAGAIGQPDVIPESIYTDPLMKLKGTPYAWWADNKVLDRVNSIREKLGIRESDLPKELKDFDYNDIKHWSNLEAKFELASLLAHPKSAITNIFGGSMHTIQSTGVDALWKARNIKFLKRINPEWNSMQDVQDFVVSKGVVPEFMIHELGLGRDASTRAKLGKFMGDLSSKINSKDPIARKEIYSLGKKHGLGDSIISKASKFMSVPERMLRRDAFMAHYIKAWERFGGAIKDPNHPFLIEMGKKGVKATQFLYEAPFRPFFARTALGKIMTRFQLFAWNSWRFRNNVIREAKRYGFKPGSEAYDRFTRTMQIDLFVMALGSMFAYSLFDNALPQPYGWLQATSEWIFGDEKERNRAFYGAYPTAIAPLQIITPPLARFPVSALMQWSRDDYTKFTDYQVYTALPFGRMVRDLSPLAKGNLIDNPSRILEKVAGMPVQQMQRYRTQNKEDIEQGKRYKQPKPGISLGY